MRLFRVKSRRVRTSQQKKRGLTKKVKRTIKKSKSNKKTKSKRKQKKRGGNAVGVDSDTKLSHSSF